MSCSTPHKRFKKKKNLTTLKQILNTLNNILSSFKIKFNLSKILVCRWLILVICIEIAILGQQFCGVMDPNHTIGFWALAESMRSLSSSPRRNISPDKLNIDRVQILVIKVTFQEALVIGTYTINIQKRWEPKNI